MRIKPRMQLFLWTLRGKPYALLSLGSLAVLILIIVILL